MTNNERFNDLLQQIEIKFGRGPSFKWKNRDYESLKFEIHKKTRIIISPLTLKRIFKKIQTADDYQPQKATIRALEQYADFNLQKNTVADNTYLTTAISHKTHDKKINKKRIFVFTFIAFVAVISFYFLFDNTEVSTPTTNEFSGASLILTKTEGVNPKTAFFSYSTPNNIDSFKILFDDSYPAIYIHNGKDLKTDYFFQYPGYYKVRMMHGYQVVSDTVPVYVETDGWQALGYYFEQKYNERYFPIDIEKCTKVGYFHARKTDLTASGMDSTRIAVVRFDNFKPTGKSGDTFVLETTLKNPEKFAAMRCNSVFLYVEGEKGTIRFRFANPGCSYWVDYILSEKYVDNRNQDLSKFTLDLNKWVDLKIENSDKKISVFVGGKFKFSDSYN